MERLFALADLHLSLAGHKPMDVFGEIWRDHPRRMAAAWDARVGAADTVLLPGDLSWARDMAEAAPDLAWLAARPGRKILLRGNHDSWWTSRAKVERALPPGCEILHNAAVTVGRWVLIGTRGWTAPGDPVATPHDAVVFRREIERLELAVADAERRFPPDAPRLAMTHYPPWIQGQPPTEIVDVLVRARVRVCVYGHLHGDDHRLAVTGRHQGIDFHFVAADALDFAPFEVPLPDA